MSTIITLMCYRILQVISVNYTLIAYKHFISMLGFLFLESGRHDRSTKQYFTRRLKLIWNTFVSKIKY